VTLAFLFFLLAPSPLGADTFFEVEVVEAVEGELEEMD
jgi:hypothetical protein